MVKASFLNENYLKDLCFLQAQQNKGPLPAGCMVLNIKSDESNFNQFLAGYLNKPRDIIVIGIVTRKSRGCDDTSRSTNDPI